MQELVLSTLLPTTNNQYIGQITLNHPKALNAQNIHMIEVISALLIDWQNDPSIAMVILRGAGEKAFCAGGDVRALRSLLESSYQDAQTLNYNADVQHFFQSEYRFTRQISTYPKPIMVWATGIVMGGGLGIAYAASHRIVTETSRLAMPEVHIGLHPDAGGSYFLNRMPARLGLFLGLTASHIKAGDALLGDLADYGIHSSLLPDILTSLQNTHWSKTPRANHDILSAILAKFHQVDMLHNSVAAPHLNWIQATMNLGSLAAIGNAIMNLETNNAWLSQAQENFISSSPSSRAITFEMARRLRGASVSTCLETELIVSMNCCARADFKEGVRALLVDKDNQPRWQHMAEHITEDDIDAYFVKPCVEVDYSCH